MCVQEACCLEKGVDRRGADELHAAPAHVGGERVRHGRSRPQRVDLDRRLLPRKRFNVFPERAEFRADRLVDARVRDDGLQFGPIADDPIRRHQPLDVRVAVGADPRNVEVLEGCPDRRALVEDALPGETRLERLEDEQLVERLIIPGTVSPLPVMVVHIQGILQIDPGTAMDDLHTRGSDSTKVFAQEAIIDNIPAISLVDEFVRQELLEGPGHRGSGRESLLRKECRRSRCLDAADTRDRPQQRTGRCALADIQIVEIQSAAGNQISNSQFHLGFGTQRVARSPEFIQDCLHIPGHPIKPAEGSCFDRTDA